MILNAFNAAAEHSMSDPEMAKIALLKDKYRLRVRGRTLEAEPKQIGPLESVRLQVQQKVVYRDKYETAEIIAALGLHNAMEVVFLGVDSADLNLPGLYAVASKRGYHMITATTHVTFSKNQEDAELAWTPEEE